MRGRMLRKNAIRQMAVLLTGLLLLAGCAGYGSVRYYDGDMDAKVKLRHMIDHFEDYNVYYAGMSEAFPSGIIFNPAESEQTVAKKNWYGVESRALAEKLIRNLERYQDYRPRLYTLTGEDGQAYGYIYTGYKHIVVRQLAENEIHVLEIHEPPHLRYESSP
jgi:hypothetical protein